MNQRIGYAKVSTDDQSLNLQRDSLKAAKCVTIYLEKVSSRKAERIELENCLKALRPGDTLVVWRLDRLGRNLSDLVKLVTMLDEKGVFLESLQEKIETESATGKLTFHVFAALAEFERNLISERTKAGLESARARGRLGGRKAKLKPKDIKEIKALLKDPNIPVTDIAKRYGVSRTTIYNNVGAASSRG
ncbi:recombinase [Pseudoalteromonas luteoviolacea]|nr:recombinase [Pseudoalteromonas luteoviolacea]